MSKEKTSGVKSVSHLFTLLLIIVILGIGGALYYAFKTLPAYASSVNEKLAQANLTSATGKGPQQATGQTLRLRANKYFVLPSTMESQLSTDIYNYAKLTAIPIQTLQFDVPAKSVTIVIAGDIPYDKFIAFLTALEGNVPKLTTTALSVKQSGSNVTVETLRAAIAVR